MTERHVKMIEEGNRLTAALSDLDLDTLKLIYHDMLREISKQIGDRK